MLHVVAKFGEGRKIGALALRQLNWPSGHPEIGRILRSPQKGGKRLNSVLIEAGSIRPILFVELVDPFFARLLLISADALRTG
jgi:hypothetical protein